MMCYRRSKDLPMLAPFLSLARICPCTIETNSWEAANQARVCTFPNEKS